MAISGGDTVTFGYSSGDARLWKKVNGNLTQVWIGGLYEEKDGKILCHVSAGGQKLATFEPEGTIACIIENQPFLAALWHGTGSVWGVMFGQGRAPLTIILLSIFVGLILALRYDRRRFYRIYGILIPKTEGLRFRQVVLTTTVGFMLLAGVPRQAFAQGPQFDPVFYYYLNDHLGSTSVMTDRNGQVVQRYGYTPFGKERYSQETAAFSVSNRYTGQVLDEDTGLYYYGARYYDPELARFVQADTIVPDPGFSQAFNRYAYVVNNPIKFSDPSGQNPFLFAVAFGALFNGSLAYNHGGNVLQAMVKGAAMAAFSYGFGVAIGQLAVQIGGNALTAGVIAAGLNLGFSAFMNGGKLGVMDFIGAALAGYGAYMKAGKVDARPSSVEGTGDGESTHVSIELPKRKPEVLTPNMQIDAPVEFEMQVYAGTESLSVIPEPQLDTLSANGTMYPNVPTDSGHISLGVDIAADRIYEVMITKHGWFGWHANLSITDPAGGYRSYGLQLRSPWFKNYNNYQKLFSDSSEFRPAYVYRDPKGVGRILNRFEITREQAGSAIAGIETIVNGKAHWSPISNCHSFSRMMFTELKLQFRPDLFDTNIPKGYPNPGLNSL